MKLELARHLRQLADECEAGTVPQWAQSHLARACALVIRTRRTGDVFCSPCLTVGIERSFADPLALHAHQREAHSTDLHVILAIEDGVIRVRGDAQ